MYKLEIKRWNRNLRIPKSYIFTCENITFFILSHVKILRFQILVIFNTYFSIFHHLPYNKETYLIEIISFFFLIIFDQNSVGVHVHMDSASQLYQVPTIYVLKPHTSQSYFVKVGCTGYIQYSCRDALSVCAFAHCAWLRIGDYLYLQVTCESLASDSRVTHKLRAILRDHLANAQNHLSNARRE